MAQACFDAYVLPRHIGLYSGVPIEVPAHLVQRVCGTGIEVLSQAADAVSLGRAELALCVGTESMSRNPIAAYTHRGGFRHGAGRVQGFPVGGAARSRRHASAWATPRRTSPGSTDHAARRWTRFAARSFERAIAARRSRLPRRRDRAGDERDLRAGRLRAARHQAGQGRRERRPPTPMSGPRPIEALAKHPAGLRRRADRRQFLGHRRWRGGGAGRLRRTTSRQPARRRSRASWRAPPSACRREIMGIGPVPAITAVLERAGPDARRHRPLRDQRGVRRAGAGLRARARPRRGQAQRQRRRDRASAIRWAPPACGSR